MEHFPKKKESGAQLWKRQKLEAEEAKKSSRFFLPFFGKPRTTSSTNSEESPAPSASFLKPKGVSSPKLPPAEVEVKLEFEDDEIPSQAATENVNMPEEGDGGGEMFPVKTEPEDTIPIEPDGLREPQTVITEVTEQHDIGLLKFDKDTGKAILPDTLKTELVKLGWRYFQNCEGPFLPTNKRSMSKAWFKRRLAAGNMEVHRSWLLYSPSKRSAFCFCCLLYSRLEPQSTLEQESGFNRWKGRERMCLHEQSKNHRECFLEWKEMERTLAENRGVVDMTPQTPFEKEKQKWREILTRILHCIKFIATQNLALQGHMGSLLLDDASDAGNLLGLMKMLAVFDPVMKVHLTQVASHPESTSYISPGVHQDEFIHMMASRVRQNLLRNIHKAKYYGLMFDSTLDQAHHERMSEMVRYVEVDFETKTARVRESFLGFIQISRKDAESLAEDILRQLEKDEMQLQHCRSQCYDDAVMSGHRSGVHQKIREKNHLAMFVNCDNHPLTFVGLHAAQQDPIMCTFFSTIEAFYAFFFHSAQRWEKLKRAVPIALKWEFETRWSARTEAVKPINRYLEKILQVLEDIIDHENETSDTKYDAQLLFNGMLTFDFLTLLGFWNKILIRIDRIQKRLQDPSMSFLDALQRNFYDDREVLVSESLEEGLSLCQEWNVDIQRCQRGEALMADEQLRDAELTAKEEMGRVMKEALAHLRREMAERFTRSHDVDTKFGFLLDLEGLCYGADRNYLKMKCENLAEFYSSDIDGQELYVEILNCRMLLSCRERISRHEQLLEFIIQYGGESVFPHLRIALQIMLTTAVLFTSSERSFGKLKLILSYLRASMGEGRISDLALLSVEREETKKTDFSDIIEQLASAEARKVQL